MTPFAVVHLSHSNSGGASTASQRLHTLLEYHSVRSLLVYKWKTTSSAIGVQLSHRCPLPFLSKLIEKVFRIPFKLLRPIQYHSLSCFTDIQLKQLTQLGDVLHLHWPHGSTLSIEDYRKIDLPLVITMHDCWYFCGAEHHFDLASAFSPFNDYKSSISQLNIRQFLLALINAHTYRRKKHSWKNLNATFVAPSRWIFELAKQSPLLSCKKIIYCPNPIPPHYFNLKPRDQRVRSLFTNPHLPILLAPISDLNDKNRPYQKALQTLLQTVAQSASLKFNLLIITKRTLTLPLAPCIDVHQTNLHKFDDKLYNILSSCDLLFYPSLSDNLPQLCIESTTQGLPIVAFNTGGVPETIPPCQHSNLVPTGHIPQLTAKTISLLSSPNVLKAQSDVALSHFDYDYNLAIRDTMINCYADAIADHITP